MDASELAAKLAETYDVSKTQARLIVDDVLEGIVDAASHGAEVSLPRFGKFKVKGTPEREGRNPSNGARIKIAAARKLVFLPPRRSRTLGTATRPKKIRGCVSTAPGLDPGFSRGSGGTR